MISTFLVEHRWVAVTALFLTIVVAPLLGAFLARRRRAAWVLFAVSLVPVLALTLLPDNRVVLPGCATSGLTFSVFAVESVANVLLLLPSTLLAGVASRRPWLAMAAGSLFSALIEGTQAIVPAIGRSCDTTDWITNTLGAVAGGLLAMLALRIARRSVRRSGTAGAR